MSNVVKLVNFKIFLTKLFQVEFPFQVLLVSGGHCLLTVAKSLDDWVIIGESKYKAPGEVFDKVSNCILIKFSQLFLAYLLSLCKNLSLSHSKTNSIKVIFKFE